MTSVEKTIVHTDGACRGNPGPGGWGVRIKRGDRVEELSGSEAQTTNNRMEMMAAIEALRATEADTTEVVLITDSTYVKNGVTQWVANWKKRNWKTAAGKPVKNQELWVLLDELAQSRSNLEWQWVKGHSGDEGNERADTLANNAIDSMLA